jgi:hypothetical protein
MKGWVRKIILGLTFLFASIYSGVEYFSVNRIFLTKPTIDEQGYFESLGRTSLALSLIFLIISIAFFFTGYRQKKRS